MDIGKVGEDPFSHADTFARACEQAGFSFNDLFVAARVKFSHEDLVALSANKPLPEGKPLLSSGKKATVLSGKRKTLLSSGKKTTVLSNKKAVKPLAPSEPEKERTRNFGVENIHCIRVRSENLALDGTTVGMAQTEGSIKLVEADVEYVYASGPITAHECTFYEVGSESPVDVTDCTFSEITSNSTVTASNCATGGYIEARSITLTNCSGLSAKVKSSVGSLIVSNCTELFLSATRQATISDSTIQALACSGNLRISKSKVHTLIINQGITATNSREKEPKIHINDTDIEDVQFVGKPGILVLRGSSKVTGTVKNGQIFSAEAWQQRGRRCDPDLIADY